jgi:hypothetical protein
MIVSSIGASLFRYLKMPVQNFSSIAGLMRVLLLNSSGAFMTLDFKE